MVNVAHIRRHRSADDTVVILLDRTSKAVHFHTVTPTDHIESLCLGKEGELLYDIVGYAIDEEEFDLLIGNKQIHVFMNGHQVKREYGQIILPGETAPMLANGRWVLRNSNNEVLDIDRYQSSILDRHPNECDKEYC